MRNSLCCSLVEYSYKINFWCFRALFVPGRQSHFLFVNLLVAGNWVNLLLLLLLSFLRKGKKKDICASRHVRCLWQLVELFFFFNSIYTQIAPRVCWLYLFNLSFSINTLLWHCRASLSSTFVVLSVYPSFFLRYLRALKENYFKMIFQWWEGLLSNLCLSTASACCDASLYLPVCSVSVLL